MKEKEFKITDPKEIEIYKNEFQEIKDYLNKQKYTSLMEERKRLNKIIISQKISAPIEEVFKKFIEISVEDLNPNISYLDLEKDNFYKSSKKNNRVIFRVNNFELNKEFSIEWIYNKQWFSKTIKLKSNKTNTKTKLTFFDITKGDTSIQGFFERHILSVYIKRQIIAFVSQVYKTRLELNLYKPNKVEKIKDKINQMHKSSKELY